MLVVALAATARPEPAHAETTAPPNIILIYTDDQRAGTERFMPTVESELRDRGVRFRNAFVENPLCCPSRAGMLTGSDSHTNGIYYNSPHEAVPGSFGGAEGFTESGMDHHTIATWLRAAPVSYYTGMFGKYLNGYGEIAPYQPPGWDVWRPMWPAGTGPYRGYYDYATVNQGAVVTTTCTAPFEDRGRCRYAADAVGSQVASFIESASAGRPFFALASFFVPHNPAMPEPQYEDAFDWIGRSYRTPAFDERDVSDKPRWIRRISRFTAEQKRAIDDLVRRQLATLRSVDDAVGDILGALASTDRLENTLIVFTSDNGFEWGDHRLVGKNDEYDEASGVPLLMRWDAAGLIGHDSRPVSSVDLAPTFAAVAGASIADGWVPDGVDILNGNVPSRRLIEHAGGGHTPAFCEVRTRRASFTKLATGEEELYIHATDPFAETNEAGSGSHRRLLSSLRRWLFDACRPRPPGFEWRRLT